MEEFSLIILCEERPHLVGSTLDSLKNQKGSFEVLVLDRDPAARALPALYPELKIRVTPIEKSLPKAMNRALKLATGTYVQFLQPGDRYISEHGLDFLSTLTPQKPHLILSKEFSWLSREKIIDAGGFDESLHFMPLQDLLYRLENRGVKPLICPRVLIDASGPSVVAVRETCRILLRHFGWKRAFNWVFFDHRARLYGDFCKTLKRAFGKKE